MEKYKLKAFTDQNSEAVKNLEKSGVGFKKGLWDFSTFDWNKLDSIKGDLKKLYPEQENAIENIDNPDSRVPLYLGGQVLFSQASGRKGKSRVVSNRIFATLSSRLLC